MNHDLFVSLLTGMVLHDCNFHIYEMWHILIVSKYILYYTVHCINCSSLKSGFWHMIVLCVLYVVYLYMKHKEND